MLSAWNEPLKLPPPPQKKKKKEEEEDDFECKMSAMLELPSWTRKYFSILKWNYTYGVHSHNLFQSKLWGRYRSMNHRFVRMSLHSGTDHQESINPLKKNKNSKDSKLRICESFFFFFFSWQKQTWIYGIYYLATGLRDKQQIDASSLISQRHSISIAYHMSAYFLNWTSNGVRAYLGYWKPR